MKLTARELEVGGTYCYYYRKNGGWDRSVDTRVDIKVTRISKLYLFYTDVETGLSEGKWLISGAPYFYLPNSEESMCFDTVVKYEKLKRDIKEFIYHFNHGDIVVTKENYPIFKEFLDKMKELPNEQRIS